MTVTADEAQQVVVRTTGMAVQWASNDRKIALTSCWAACLVAQAVCLWAGFACMRRCRCARPRLADKTTQTVLVGLPQTDKEQFITAGLEAMEGGTASGHAQEGGDLWQHGNGSGHGNPYEVHSAGVEG